MSMFYLAHFGAGSEVFEPCVFTKAKRIHIGDNVRIDSFSKLEGGEGLFIGDGVHIASFSHINTGGGTLFIGKGVGIASGVKIITGQPDLQYLDICPQSENFHPPIRKKTFIGAYVFLGAGCTIMPGVEIGMGAVIGANSLVIKDVPSMAVYQTNPAEQIRNRLLAKETGL